jgi:hypothetical protein
MVTEYQQKPTTSIYVFGGNEFFAEFMSQFF